MDLQYKETIDRAAENRHYLDEIVDYWTDRAAGYAKLREDELTGEKKEAWVKEILSFLPEHLKNRPRQEIRILDAGCGPGFFSMILAEAGFSVTGVDVTLEMLKKARAATKNAGFQVTYLQGDVQDLPFSDESFDIVVSRNLTWILKTPAKAYKEWYRVLAPGGMLVNFDANWYCYLFDEALRKGYEEDREATRRLGVEDSYLGTNIEAMEALALRAPLSAQHRPAWDEIALSDVGFSEITSNTRVWEDVWTREEKINSSSTPMFVVRAYK